MKLRRVDLVDTVHEEWQLLPSIAILFGRSDDPAAIDDNIAGVQLRFQWLCYGLCFTWE